MQCGSLCAPFPCCHPSELSFRDVSGTVQKRGPISKTVFTTRFTTTAMEVCLTRSWQPILNLSLSSPHTSSLRQLCIPPSRIPRLFSHILKTPPIPVLTGAGPSNFSLPPIGRNDAERMSSKQGFCTALCLHTVGPVVSGHCNVVTRHAAGVRRFAKDVVITCGSLPASRTAVCRHPLVRERPPLLDKCQSAD